MKTLTYAQKPSVSIYVGIHGPLVGPLSRTAESGPQNIYKSVPESLIPRCCIIHLKFKNGVDNSERSRKLANQIISYFAHYLRDNY